MAIQLREAKTQKLLLFSMMGLALLYVDFLTSLFPFTFKASAAQLKQLSGHYQDLSADLTKARQVANSLPYLEKEYNLLHMKWEKARRLLPDDEETASLLRAMTLLGDQSGVEFVLFRPMPPQPAQYYTERPIEVKVQGGYHEIGAFLGEVANMERIVTISDLTIESTKASKGSEVDKPAEATFTAKTYTRGGTGVPPGEAQGQGQASGQTEKPAGMTKAVEKAAQKMGQEIKAKARAEVGHGE